MNELDLPAQFDARVKKMLIAVDQGRLAHKARNIKASGAPLEEAVRSLFSDSLPSNNKVASGYFYSASSRCSAEVDVLIYESEEAFRLDPAPQEQHYVPYTSVSAIGQIKNSAGELPNAIKQVQESLKAWTEMRNEALRGRANGDRAYRERPLTFIVCGKCTDSDFRKLKTMLKSKGRPYVDYILLLDRGKIVAGNYDLFELNNPVINFFSYRNVSSLHLCAPNGAPDYPQGIALLWIYFAVVSKLNWDKGNMLRYNEFCRHIEIIYPLQMQQQLL
ncbi:MULTISPECIES: DUF6602 domain-containing protein [unclassified Janthinobacterium]|uniref:DUF6602 domain-containing protein n=1 Tax=unclassified Janthinobacterium TaxID=2610881 RepID=UPI0016100F85|nr:MULTISPECIES: DUF6602 domain-containing protein [unclassified Janthinobacterium]MBB5371327.1 hypothetical protein [Janthinobacterium sp. K2C7]MBB5384133.1 hypothetical protein [Janthinobacterium sp. K2Li3]MBB5389407.1 hypothetical protein [Janthinobacterium sp. K2E3]